MTVADPVQKTPIGYSVRGVVMKAGGINRVAHALELHPNAVRAWRLVPDRHAELVAVMSGLPLGAVRPDLVE